jgi:hypothetical protein
MPDLQISNFRQFLKRHRVATAELRADSPRGVFVQKQRANVYTMMLILSLMFIMVGCLCMFLEMNAFQMKVKVPPDAQASSVPEPQPPAPVTQPGS